MEITCRGSLRVVVTNGIEIQRINRDELKHLYGSHWQYKPVSGRPRKGFIGLHCDRGEPTEFRNIQSRPLGESDPS